MAAVDVDGLATSAGPSEYLPLWFERALVVAIAGVLSFGGFGLLLAVLGDYRMLWAFLFGAAGTVVGSVIAWPRKSSSRPSRGITLPALGMCIVALGFAVWNGLDSGHYVSVDRDPGVYATAGKWVAEHGSLEVSAGMVWVDKGHEFNWGSAGMYPEGAGRLEFQFNHLTAVLLAEGDNLGGDRLLFAMPAVLGALALCGVYAAGCRLVRRPWLVLVAVSALAISLPQLSVSRDTYSETSAQFLLWSGMWLTLIAFERRRLGVSLLAGATIAGAMLSRVDALVYLIPLPTLAVLAWLAAGSREDRRFRLRMYAMVLLGAAPVAALGTIDVMYRAGGYYNALHTQVKILQAGFALSVAVGLALVVGWPRLPALRRWARRHRQRAAFGLGLMAIFGLTIAWALRPAFPLERLRGPNPTVAALQQAEGLPLDPTRSYSEQTMVWMSWYLGPIALTLAIIGTGILVARLVRRPDPAVALILFVAGIGTVLYLVTPQITPEQIWAMRRYVPAALPFLLLAAAVAVDAGLVAAIAVLKRTTLRTSGIVKAVTAAIVLAMIGFPLATTWPDRSFSSQAGFIGVIDDTCAYIGPDAAVLFVNDDRLRITLPQTMRSFCGAESADLVTRVSAQRIKEIADSWQAQGKALWVLGTSPALVATAAPGLTSKLVASATNTHLLERTLSRPPKGYQPETLSIYAARVSP